MRAALVFLLSATLVLPSAAIAASDDLPAPPKPTNTTKTCKGKKVWDENKGRCVRPRKSSLNADGLYQAARELAYAGRYEDAQHVLSAMPDQQDDRVLTYWGFTYRKLGQLDLATMFYERAISLNPDNLLARSYMGQGLVSDGRTAQAVAQWREIIARGGEGSWPELSLRNAIRTGSGYDY